MSLERAHGTLKTLVEDQGAEGIARAQAQVLLDLSQKAAIDHLRLFRVEMMLAFLLRRQVVENKRRPAEGETVLPGVAFVLQSRTWLDEFNEEYKQAVEAINAAQAATPSD